MGLSEGNAKFPFIDLNLCLIFWNPDDFGLHVGFGHVRCEISLLGQKATLFDFNFGNRNVWWPHKMAMVAQGKVLDLMPQTVRTVASSHHEAVRTVFSVGWELMHCPHRGHHHQLIQCLGRWVHALAPPLHWMPDPIKTVANGHIFHLLGDRVNKLANGEIMRLLNDRVNKLANGEILSLLPDQVNKLVNGQILSLLPDPVKQLVNGQILNLLPNPVKQLANGQILSLLPHLVQRVAHGQILSLLPAHMQLLGSSHPNSVANMVKMGTELMQCSEAAAEGDVVQCLGYKIIGSVPPLNFLNHLGDIFEEFIASFAMVASKLATQAIKGGESFLQTAATTEFPAAGAHPVVHHKGPSKLSV